MKTASSSSVAVSFGSRAPEAHHAVLARAPRPPTITRPSTSSAFANSEPMIEVCATTISPACEREHHDEELGQVAERRLQHAGDGRAEPLADRLRRERDDHPREPRERDAADAEDNDYGFGARVVEHSSDGRHDSEHADENEVGSSRAGRSPSARTSRSSVGADAARAFSAPSASSRSSSPSSRAAPGTAPGPAQQLDDRLADVPLELRRSPAPP